MSVRERGEVYRIVERSEGWSVVGGVKVKDEREGGKRYWGEWMKGSDRSVISRGV